MQIYQRFIFAFIYSVVYFGLALEIVGTEGMGSPLFFAPVITWILVLIAIFLMANDLSGFRKIFVSVLLGVHYGVTFLSVFNNLGQDEGNFAHSWSRASWAVISAIVWYVTGQVALWILIYRSRIEVHQLN